MKPVTVFQAVQTVVLFAAWPFLIVWLARAEFVLAPLFLICAVLIYTVGLIAMIGAVSDTIEGG